MTALLTTDLLEVWTDPDTAMEAVGANLGLFDEHVPSPAKAIATDERLRNTLFDVLLSLVEGGALEMRPLGDGRHAFRWHADVLDGRAPMPVAAPVEVLPAPPPAPTLPIATTAPPRPTVIAVPLPPADADVPGVAQISAPPPQPGASRPILQAPLLVVPALSCLVAVLSYLWLPAAFAIAVVAVMFVVGVVGVIRRVPFAGAWIVGIVAAGLLLRFS